MPRDDDELLPIAERRAAGQRVRKYLPRGSHAEWKPPPDRRDPIQILIETSRHRVPSLLPLRYGRMRASPLAYLRGAAAVMAADLARTPTSGMRVQACGDCHLMNFGVYASPEGAPVFDVNDFDETLPAPFEWDVKRLATSFALACRVASRPEKTTRTVARTAVLAYRAHMAELLRLSPLAAWRSVIGVAAVLTGIEDPKLRVREERRLALAVDASRKGYPRLIARTSSGLRLRTKPPLLSPLEDDAHEQAARTAFDSYKATLQEDRHVLVDRYRLVDVAFKVVGVGSVGTFCAVGLFATADGDPLLLQIKEAEVSVLAPFAGPSVYQNQGQRVVTGQRMLQATPDVFLGWTEAPGDDRHCYVRQLKDSRLAAIGTDLDDAVLPYYAQVCGQALARAHARSGDIARIVGYMGSGGAFDSAIADFALAYAEQTERDWRLLLEAIRAGWIEAAA
jgi:uncharacterized protein (DUF2252 family)